MLLLWVRAVTALVGAGARVRVVVGSFSGTLGLGGERVGVGPEARCEQHG